MDSFGHLTNIKYIQIFEDARWQMLTDHGYGFEIMPNVRPDP
ncbi:thioesterase family protein [Leptospira kmetyi]